MTYALPIPATLNVEAGLATYIQAINAQPILSADEEHDLALRYRRDGDLEAARQLVLTHLRYVVRVARGLSGYGLPQADLIQEGNIGLMKAVKDFDPMRGVRLMSFAIHWIRAQMYDYILRNWRMVKVATTKAQRKLFFNLRKSRARLEWMKPDEVHALADNLDVPPETVQEMESRMSGADIPFDTDDRGDDDELRVAPATYLQDMRYNPETLVTRSDHESTQQDNLDQALTALDERSRNIIRRRWLDDDKSTLLELAVEYGVSAERIRQIEKKAFDIMKNKLVA
ncbi:MAG: RNA polymerase sigma factor RpoH [Gammaproteobacteria bacterium]|nr:RNA polymerase sigma factor RpoH [Gammaproteobacteria bacterium]